MMTVTVPVDEEQLHLMTEALAQADDPVTLVIRGDDGKARSRPALDLARTLARFEAKTQRSAKAITRPKSHLRPVQGEDVGLHLVQCSS